MNKIPLVEQKDFICTQDWPMADLLSILDLACWLKYKSGKKVSDYLKGKVFLMLFYNPSVRTRISFEVALAQLGGRGIFMEPRVMRLKDAGDFGETVEDVAKVASRYVSGIGVRILEDQIQVYGQGDAIIREYAKYATIPVISLAHDKFHPCQGLADIMAWSEWLDADATRDMSILDNLRGKRLLITWAMGKMARSWGSVQEALLVGSRFGMDITLAYPEGYDLDPEVIKAAKTNCENNSQTFRITHDTLNGYRGANIVYSRNWISPQAYEGGRLRLSEEKSNAAKHPEWICTIGKMRLTDHGIFTHPMPIDRNREVEDSVASGPLSCIYDVAENRLHIEKALLMALMSIKTGDPSL